MRPELRSRDAEGQQAADACVIIRAGEARQKRSTYLEKLCQDRRVTGSEAARRLEIGASAGRDNGIKALESEIEAALLKRGQDVAAPMVSGHLDGVAAVGVIGQIGVGIAV